MAVAPARFTSPRPALPSTPWLGLRRAARRLRSFLEETPLRATTPLHTSAGPSNPPVGAPLVGAPTGGLLGDAAGAHRGRPSTPIPGPAPPTSPPLTPGASPRPVSASSGPRGERRVFWKKLLCARRPRFAPPPPVSHQPGPPASRPPQAHTPPPGLSRTPWSGTVRHCLPTGRPA